MTTPISNDALARVMTLLAKAGETELAETIAKHSEARKGGASVEELRAIWLRG